VEQDGSSENIPLADILAILPRLQPRLYSLSSSSITSPTVVETFVGVVHAHTNDGVHIAGVCSNYLARLKPMHVRACISIRTSSFRVPDDMCEYSHDYHGWGWYGSCTHDWISRGKCRYIHDWDSCHDLVTDVHTGSTVYHFRIELMLLKTRVKKRRQTSAVQIVIFSLVFELMTSEFTAKGL
jgi:hypothetical protein